MRFLKYLVVTFTVDYIHKTFICCLLSVRSLDKNKVWGMAFPLEHPTNR